MLNTVAAFDSGEIRFIEDQAEVDLSETLSPAFGGQTHDALASPMLVRPERLGATTLYMVSLEDAYLVIMPGLDGVILTSDGRLVSETAHFVEDRSQLEDLGALMRDALPLDASLFVSIDMPWFNYYHWICFAIGKCGLADQHLEAEDEFAFTDYGAHAGTDVAPRYKRDVWEGSLDLLPGSRLKRLLAAGVYRVRTLRFLTTVPTTPTEVTHLASFYEMFRTVANRETGPAQGGVLVLRNDVARLSPELAEGLQVLASARDYRIVRLEELSFADQRRTFATASHIVAPHGAGLANLLFGRPSLSVLELNSPQDRGAALRPWFYLLSHGMGQDYRYLDVSSPDLTLDCLAGALDGLERTARLRTQRRVTGDPEPTARSER